MASARAHDELDRYRWLLSHEGESLMASIRERMDAGETILRLSETLRDAYPADLVALALTQVQLREQAKAKFADADRLFFTREGLEQATSDRIAGHRASRYSRFSSVFDLCTGIGGDLMALAGLTGDRRLVAVDLDPVHLLLAKRNAATVAPGREITSLLDDVRSAPVSQDDAVFIDPARRDTRGRMGGVASEPPLDWAIALAERAAGVGIKTAPGIPHDKVPDEWEMETIALETDLKEAVLWSPALASSSRSATIITDGGIHRLESVPGEPVSVRAPVEGDLLLDPNPAVTRAGLVEELARLVDAQKIDDEIGFLVTGHAVETPFARSLRVIRSMPWHEKRVKQVLREIEAGPVDIRRRGLAGDVAAITKRLRGRGGRRVTIAMTRYRGEPWAIVCVGA